MLHHSKGVPAQAFLNALIETDPTKGDYFRHVASDKGENYDESVLMVRGAMRHLTDLLQAAGLELAAAGEVFLVAGILALNNYPLPDGTPAPDVVTDSAAAMQEHFLQVLEGVLPTILTKAFATFDKVVAAQTANAAAAAADASE